MERPLDVTKAQEMEGFKFPNLVTWTQKVDSTIHLSRFSKMYVRNALNQKLNQTPDSGRKKKVSYKTCTELMSRALWRPRNQSGPPNQVCGSCQDEKEKEKDVEWDLKDSVV